MANKKKFVTAAAAFAVTASAVAPAITADAASQTVRLKTDYVRSANLDAVLDKEYNGSEIYWYKSSIDLNKLGVFQTAKGFVKGKGIKVEKSLRVLNYVKAVQPAKEIVLEQGVPASGLRIQPVLFADGNLYEKPVSVQGFNTDKVGEFEGSFTYANKAFGSVTTKVKYKVVATKVAFSEVKHEVMDDVLSVTADVKNLKEGEKVELVVYAGRDMNAALPAVQAEVKDGKVMVKSSKLPAGNHSFILRSGEVKTEAMNFVVEAPMVKEVKAINAAQVEISFNKAIDAASVLDTDGTLKTGVLTFAKVDGTGAATISGSSLAKLNADKTSLIVNVDTGSLNNLKYVLTVNGDVVKTTAGVFVPKFISNVSVASDTTAPSVTSVEKLNASDVRVYFSEPLSSAGNWTFKLANGSTASVTPNTANLAKGYVDLQIGAEAAGAQITATIVGAADFANNLISPNPTTVQFAKGQLDGTKPTVSSISALGLNKFEVKFSEEVQGLDGSDFTIDTVALADVSAGTSAFVAGEARVTQDSTDKTKYVVELASPVTAGLHTIGLVVNAVSDLSGEQNAAFSRVVEFKADTIAPKLVSSVVKKDNGVEYLHLTFNEGVDKEAALSSLNARQVKNFVTVDGAINLNGLTAVSGSNDTEYKVALNTVQFTPTSGVAAAIQEGAVYTVTLTPGFEDKSDVDLEATTISFTRGSDTDTSKPSIVTTTDAGELNPKVASNGIEVVDTDTIRVTFDRALDGATATNKANYMINGATVKSATLLPNNVVEVKFEDNTINLDGLRNVSVSGVKSSAGVTMDAYNTTEYFVENVKPVVTSASLIAADKVKVVFSEGVDVTKVSAADLDVFVGTTQEIETGLFAVTADNASNGYATSFTITLADGLSSAEYAQTLTLKVVNDATASNIITDAKGNKVVTGTYVISK